jgi:SAM-dependent methyltransferase
VADPNRLTPPNTEDPSFEHDFKVRVREQVNTEHASRAHHPWGGYTPLAFRHYIRRIALLDTLSRLGGFSTVLDVGCAEGFFMDAIQQRFGADVWGVDLSTLLVSRVRERFGSNVAAGDANSLPFRDGSFDLVVSTETIEHVPAPDTMVAEMRRVSRRWVVVTTPVSALRDHKPDFELADSGHINEFDRGTVERLFGAEATIGSFRTNATLAAIVAVGRHLPRPFRDWFYALDYWTSQRLGSPEHRFKPLRNRDWLITTTGLGGGSGEPSWACPRCHELVAEDRAHAHLQCPGCGSRYPVANAVPDFFIDPAG